MQVDVCWNIFYLFTYCMLGFLPPIFMAYSSPVTWGLGLLHCLPLLGILWNTHTYGNR